MTLTPQQIQRMNDLRNKDITSLSDEELRELQTFINNYIWDEFHKHKEHA